MTYVLSPATRAVLKALEELRHSGSGIEQTIYTTDAVNEAVDSRIIDGPASELIPPGRGRSTTRGMRP